MRSAVRCFLNAVLSLAGREGKRERVEERAAAVLLEAVSHSKDPPGDDGEDVSKTSSHVQIIFAGLLIWEPTQL